MDGEPSAEAALPLAVDLHQRIRAITTGVISLSRVGALGMVALSIVALAQAHGFANRPVAVATYAAVAAWSAVFLPAILLRDPIPRALLAVDIAVTGAAVAVLPWALREDAFATVAVPDFEPVGVSAAVGVALATASLRATTLGCLALAAAFVVADRAAPAYVDVASTVNVIGWQVVTAACCCVFVRRLRAVADAVDAATEQVIAARERLAARRSQAEERVRHFHEQLRRHRALHDGPLRLLTAIAGPGPAGHPDPRVRRQAAISANVLRGATPDHPDGTLTELSLALIEAGNDSATQGLRVEYHFANLPDTLPAKVVHAFRHAAGEALAALTAELMSMINDDPPELSPQEARALYLYGTGSTLAATARRMGVTIPSVRSYLTRIRAKWAAIDEPVDDVRTLVHEYQPRPGPPE